MRYLRPRELWLMDAEDAVGRRIARARKLRGLTQTGLAGRAHVSKSLIAQVESGHKPATPSRRWLARWLWTLPS